MFVFIIVQVRTVIQHLLCSYRHTSAPHESPHKCGSWHAATLSVHSARPKDISHTAKHMYVSDTLITSCSLLITSCSLLITSCSPSTCIATKSWSVGTGRVHPHTSTCTMWSAGICFPLCVLLSDSHEMFGDFVLLLICSYLIIQRGDSGYKYM